MDRIARINGKDVFISARINKKSKSINNHINEDSKGFLINEHQTDDTSIKVQEEYSVINALRDRTVFVNLVVAMFCFAGASFNYYLMGFYFKYMSGDIYINTIMSTVADTVSNFSVSYIQK